MHRLRQSQSFVATVAQLIDEQLPAFDRRRQIGRGSLDDREANEFATGRSTGGVVCPAAVRIDTFDEHERTDGDAGGIAGGEQPRLERGERAGLDEGVEPDALEHGEVATEPSHPRAAAPQIAGRAEAQRWQPGGEIGSVGVHSHAAKPSQSAGRPPARAALSRALQRGYPRSSRLSQDGVRPAKVDHKPVARAHRDDLFAPTGGEADLNRGRRRQDWLRSRGIVDAGCIRHGADAGCSVTPLVAESPGLRALRAGWCEQWVRKPIGRGRPEWSAAAVGSRALGHCDDGSRCETSGSPAELLPGHLELRLTRMGWPPEGMCP